MKVRVGIGAGGHGFASPADFWRWVAQCEDSAIDSLWCSDRLVSETPSLEPLSLMAALAGATKRLQFGMNAVVLPYRDPLVLAKQCATADWLSGGRLLTVFGVGHKNDRAWAATGRNSAERGRRSDEMLALMNRLFSEDQVSFAGEFYKYDRVSIAPKPLRRPLPLWIGGDSDAAIRRTARYGTGWLGGLTPLERGGEIVTRITAEAAAAGRRIDPDHFGVTFGFRFGRADDEAVARFTARRAEQRGGAAGPTGYAIGGAEDIIAHIARFVGVGVSKFVAVPLASDGADFNTQTARLARDVIPAAQALGEA